MYTITYSLKENLNNSDNYYNDISLFTNEVLQKAKESIGSISDEYINFIKTIKPSDNTSIQEYYFEILMLGVLWKVYSGDAHTLEKGPRDVLNALFNLRQKGGFIKPGVDFVRGFLSTIFLSPDLYDNMYSLSPAVKHLEILLDWLEATGEFKYEVIRLRNWHKYIELKPKEEGINIIASSIAFAAWFEERSEEYLGRYTPNVERFLNEIRPNHYWKEDVIFCGRRRVEYHLSMLGAEIMNLSFKNDFLNTKTKIVVVPSCMCLLRDKCNAIETLAGFDCVNCMKECSVNKLKGLGNQLGFKVLIIPHGSSLSSSWEKGSRNNESVGVIGVACILNLVSGGLMLKEAGIPAQCVLLDFCGCKKHWHQEGIPTEINEGYLKKLLSYDK